MLVIKKNIKQCFPNGKCKDKKKVQRAQLFLKKYVIKKIPDHSFVPIAANAFSAAACSDFFTDCPRACAHSLPSMESMAL